METEAIVQDEMKLLDRMRRNREQKYRRNEIECLRELVDGNSEKEQILQSDGLRLGRRERERHLPLYHPLSGKWI